MLMQSRLIWVVFICVLLMIFKLFICIKCYGIRWVIDYFNFGVKNNLLIDKKVLLITC